MFLNINCKQFMFRNIPFLIFMVYASSNICAKSLNSRWMKMAKIGLQKGSGKRLNVREKSVKSQGILKWILSGNPGPVNLSFSEGFFLLFLCEQLCDTVFLGILIWASARDFQQFDILTSVDSDGPLQPPVMLRNSKWRSVSSLTIIEYSSDKQRLWSGCAYAQAGLRLCWSHIPNCWKSHALAHFFSKSIRSSSGQAIFNFRKFQRNKGECCCFLDRQYLIPQYICVIKVNAFFYAMIVICFFLSNDSYFWVHWSLMLVRF